MKAIHVVLAVEVLAIAIIVYRARVPDPQPRFNVVTDPRVQRISASTVRRGSARSVSPGTIGAAEFRTDGGPTLY